MADYTATAINNQLPKLINAVTKVAEQLVEINKKLDLLLKGKIPPR
jgi:hypothetical protein